MQMTWHCQLSTGPTDLSEIMSFDLISKVAETAAWLSSKSGLALEKLHAAAHV